MENIPLVIAWIVSLIGSGIFHEQAHARVALWLGDPTGKNQGRLSWDPRRHIDPWMSIILPALLLYSSGGRFAFGGMKPVRINPGNFENPTLGMALSAAAGPISNAILAVGGFLALWGLHTLAPDYVIGHDGSEHKLTLNGLFLSVFCFANLMLGAFNLLPLPGLDGSRVLYHFLPRGGRAVMDAIEPYALLITMFIVYMGAASIVLAPVFALFGTAIALTLGPEFISAMVHSL